MLYADAPALRGLGYVVMDEVHYLADRFRGAVWEEVIIHLPDDVALVSLSATVSNAEEFADWLVTVRGDTQVVVSEVRPIPLWQHMLVGGRVFDLFALRPGAHLAGDVQVSARQRGAAVVDPELVRYVKEQERRLDSWHGGASRRTRDRYEHRPRWSPPGRAEVLTRLDAAGLLPAITFVFSRKGCDAAVEQCLGPGCGSPTRPSGPTSPRWSTGTRARCTRPTSRCSGSGSGGRACWPASPPTTPVSCRPSRRPSRSASCAGWSRPCSPPRPWRWASTCRPAPSCSRS